MIAVATVALVAAVGAVGPAQAGSVSTNAGTGATAAAQPNPAAARAAAQVAAVPTPKLSWKPCKENRKLDCARVAVPLDYDLPKGATVSLRVIRRPADDPGRRTGSLFLNPGGPGASGVQTLLPGVTDGLYTPTVRARFDIVSFDPRGVEDSGRLQCFDTTKAALRTKPSFGFPVTMKEERQWVAADRALSQACVRRAGAIIDHMSTANVARDLDVLRRAVGDRQLTYAGYSYGSYLGQTYANLFPDKVRAIVLDGVIDPVAWATGRGDQAQRETTSVRIGGADGAAETFAQFLELCKRGGPRCAFSAGDPAKRFARLADSLRRSGPILLPNGKGGRTVPFSYQDLITLTAAINAPSGWPDLAKIIDALETNKLARAAALLGEFSPPAPEPEPGAPYDQSVLQENRYGVLCADSDNPKTVDAIASTARDQERRYPYFGRVFAWESICSAWPGQDADRYTGPFDTPTAHPLLVVNTLFDPATPYAGAVAASKILPGSRLLTVNGWGHVTVVTGSNCADRHVATYLLNGTLPAEGTQCAPDEVPFAAPSKESNS